VKGPSAKKNDLPNPRISEISEENRASDCFNNENQTVTVVSVNT